MLQKSSTLVEHRREVIAISFDKTLCASIATDNQVVVTRIIGETGQMRQTKVLLAKEFPAGDSPIFEQSCVAIKCIEAIGTS